MYDSINKGSADITAKLERKLKKLADKYGIFTKEEFFQAYNTMERIDIGAFVTPFSKEPGEK